VFQVAVSLSEMERRDRLLLSVASDWKGLWSYLISRCNFICHFTGGNVATLRSQFDLQHHRLNLLFKIKRFRSIVTYKPSEKRQAPAAAASWRNW
jgi:hypothetical protein